MSRKKEQMTINFEAYGVTVGVDFQQPFKFEEVLDSIHNAIPTNLKIINNDERTAHPRKPKPFYL